MSKFKVTFIYPSFSNYRATDALETLVFAILKSLTPPDIETVLYDDRLEDIPFDDPTNLVAMSVDTFCAKRAYLIAKKYRDKRIPVVMGGFHPSLYSQEVLNYADSVVIGSAEPVWKTLLADARTGKLQRVYQAPEDQFSHGIIPDRSIFQGKRYGKLHVVQFSRGCRFQCDFCSIHVFYKHSLQYRSVEDIVREIKGLSGRTIYFADDNIFTNAERTRALVQAILPLKIHWACQISIDIINHPDLLSLMRESGLFCVTIGFESLSQSNLKQIMKGWNTSYGSYEAAIRKIREQGIMTFGTFVFGYDDDTPEAFQAVLNFATKNKLFLAHFNPLTPTPGTALYERLLKEDRLINHPWWLNPNFRYGQATFRPRQMTPEQLQSGCYNSRMAFNSWRNLFKRLIDFKANSANFFNCAIFLMANIITRKEIIKKQGAHLGEK
ncbi:MAG: B12-binding domain-containing radical SAM protein [Bdellovibrio sp.]|nr:B12-binding domain-containing radical SAM protein [Bdellovibrio sp.]